MTSLGPNLQISHDWAGAQPWVGLGEPTGVSSAVRVAGEGARCGGPGLAWLHVVAVVRPVGRTAKFSKMSLEVAYGRERNIQLSGNSSVGHYCSWHANCTLPQNLRHLCDKTAHFRVALYCPQHNVYWCNDHAV